MSFVWVLSLIGFEGATYDPSLLNFIPYVKWNNFSLYPSISQRWQS